VTNVVLTLGTDVIFSFDGSTVTARGTDSPATGHNLVANDDWAYAEPMPVANSFPIVDGSAGVSAAAAIASGSAGVPFTGVVGSFSDDDPAANVKDYTATINWGDGHLTNGTITGNSNGGFDVSGTNTYAQAGLYAVSVDVMDFGGGPGAGGSMPTLAIDNTVKVNGHVLATGADQGGGPEVKVYDPATGDLKLDFFAYNPGFTGGVRVAVADMNNDGVPDIITAPGPTGGPDIRVFDGSTGQIIQEFMAYNPTFTGGVFIAVGDINGDGKPDIVTAPDQFGGPDVRVFFNGNTSGVPDKEFGPFSPGFLGGVRLAVGNINGHADIIAGAGPSAAPEVQIFDASGTTVTQIGDFLAYNPGFTGGVYVAAGDVNGDGIADIITGAGAGGGPEVKAFDGSTLGNATPSVLDDFFAYNIGFTGGARVAALDVNGDGKADIITGAGPGGGPNVRIFDGGSGALLPNVQDNFFAYDPAFTGGVFVGAG
jgi:hypothetical protein